MEDDDRVPLPKHTLLSQCIDDDEEIDEQRAEEDDSESTLECDDEPAPVNFTVPTMSCSDRSCGNDIDDPNPLHFHQEVNDRDRCTTAKLRCSACLHTSTSFFCASCIRNGEFTSSKCVQVPKEKFHEKKLKLLLLQEKRDEYFRRIEGLITKDSEIDRLRMKASRHEFNIEALKKEIARKEQEIERTRARLKEVKAAQEVSKQQPNYRKTDMTRAVINQCKDKVNLRRDKVNEYNQYIKEETHVLVHQLKQCIFNIEPYLPG